MAMVSDKEEKKMVSVLLSRMPIVPIGKESEKEYGTGDYGFVNWKYDRNQLLNALIDRRNKTKSEAYRQVIKKLTEGMV